MFLRDSSESSWLVSVPSAEAVLLAVVSVSIKNSVGCMLAGRIGRGWCWLMQVSREERREGTEQESQLAVPLDTRGLALHDQKENKSPTFLNEATQRTDVHSMYANTRQ